MAVSLGEVFHVGAGLAIKVAVFAGPGLAMNAGVLIGVDAGGCFGVTLQDMSASKKTVIHINACLKIVLVIVSREE